MHKPAQSIKAFALQTRKQNLWFQNYGITKLGRANVSDDLRRAQELRAAKTMKAVNPHTRIQFAKTTSSALKTWFRENEITEFYFVTLIWDEHAMPLRLAARHDIFAQRRWIKQQLAGFDFLGMIDVALYQQAPFQPGRREPWVSWHAHLIVWNVSKKEIETLGQAVNRRYQPFLPGASAFHARREGIEQLEARLAYICKLPATEYNAWLVRVPAGIDPRTGERLMRVTERFTQNKRSMRPGNYAKMLKVMGVKRSLLLFCVGGGEGLDLKGHTARAARSRLKRDERKRDEKLHRELYGPQKRSSVTVVRLRRPQPSAA